MRAEAAAHRRVYVVVQTIDSEHVQEQASLALGAGADGILLIDHDRDDRRLFDACLDVRRTHPRAFVGANLIGRSPIQALHSVIAAGLQLDALWTDDAQIRLDGNLGEAVAFLDLREQLGWSGLHFGGVAFKHQAPVRTEQLARLGSLASGVVDVPTTSGPGTGKAISLERLAELRRGLGDRPLAVASGVSVDNIDALGPLLTTVLVSSSITDGTGRIDATALATLVRRFNAQTLSHASGSRNV